MFNRPTSSWSNEVSPAESGWDVDRNPQIRLTLLWAVFFLPLLVIGGRVVQLQLSLQDDFASAFSSTTTTYEDLPVRDGRILAADGSVLADDFLQYDIAVDYQAIQDPPQDSWLTKKALPRLSKKDRRDKALVAAEKEKIVAENERFWTRLSELTERPLEQILAERHRQQARVTHIKESVQRRLAERQADAEKLARQSNPTGSSWLAAWQVIRERLEDRRERPSSDLWLPEEDDSHTVIVDVSPDIKAEIEARHERYPYAHVQVRKRRMYPQGELAAHLIGVRKPISDEQLKKRLEAFPDGDPLDYRVGDLCGEGGLEQQYDSPLKGVRGRVEVVKNSQGEVISTKVIKEPRHGTDLKLTIDTAIQRRTEQLLANALKQVTLAGTIDPESSHNVYPEPTCPQGACLVACDVHTGAILTAASMPTFDANLRVSADAQAWEDVMSDRRSPLLSRATRMILEPGSVFKVISAVASIESGAMHPDASFYCQGYLDRPNSFTCMAYRHQGYGHGDVTLVDALCRSCNVYFFAAARRMGPQSLVNWSHAFGIGERTGIDLPSESSGRLPSPEDRVNGRQNWKPGDTLQLAIGQSRLQVTPLQMVRMMAAVANDGYLITPRLAADSDSSPTAELRQIPGLHRGTLDQIRHGLVMVVHDPHGTGYKTVRMKEVTIAGKTGTAQNPGVDHAWFAGYVPAEQPRIAFVVVLQNGGSGGKVAGPVAHEFVKVLLEEGLVHKAVHTLVDRK